MGLLIDVMAAGAMQRFLGAAGWFRKFPGVSRMTPRQLVLLSRGVTNAAAHAGRFCTSTRCSRGREDAPTL